MQNQLFKKHMAMRHIQITNIPFGLRRVLKNTLKIYRAACAYIINVVLKHWDEILSVTDSHEKQLYVEALIHYTKDNPSPRYKDFDKLFFKFPSYYRRSAVSFALGAVSSYFSNLEEWEGERDEVLEKRKPFHKKPPVLNPETGCFPTLYHGNCFMEGERPNTARIKVFIKNTWNWITVSIDKRDTSYHQPVFGMIKKICCPSLQFKHDKFYLCFPIEYRGVKFREVPLDKQTVLAVDRGINHGAVCSIVDLKGNVYGRFFDPFDMERAGIEHMLSLVHEKQRKSGVDQSIASVYEKLDGIKTNYARQLAHWLVNIAVENHVYGIVFEHLGDMRGRAKGKLKERVQHWTKKRFFDLTYGMAARVGIRVFRINPKNTSKLAYDGSGEVSRDNDNYSLCTFKTGKRYHADLSASYNIGARYFLRELERAASGSKPTDKAFELWKRLKAEVPETAKRTDCTLSTLWKTKAVLAA